MKINHHFSLFLFLCSALFLISPSGLVFANNEEKSGIAKLVKELEDENPDIRKKAVKAVRDVFRIIHSSKVVHSLKKIDEQFKPELVKAMEKRLTDSEKNIRYFAAVELLSLNRHYNVAANKDLAISVCIEALNEALVDENPDLKVIERIIIHLQDFKESPGAKRNEVISVLKKHSSNKHKLIRYEVAATLGELDYINSKNLIMPVFLEALYDADEDAAISIRSRMQILKACKSIGPDAKETLPGLVHALKNEIKRSGGGLIMLPPIYIKALESVTGSSIILMVINDSLTYPVVNLFIALCFGRLFWWSIKLREKGKKVFHRFLPVPASFYACYCVYNIAAKTNASFELMYNYKIFIFFISIGFIPWLLSWLFYKQSANPSR